MMKSLSASGDDTAGTFAPPSQKQNQKKKKIENSIPQINTRKFVHVIEEDVFLKILGDDFDESSALIQFLVPNYDLIKLNWQRHQT